MPNVIPEFQGKYRWLSNFWPAWVELGNISFTSVECAYQAAKTDDVNVHLHMSYMTASEAKRHGKQIEPSNWRAKKLDVMEKLLMQKFATGELHDKLLATGDAQLIEGNDWGDTFWGVCNGVGENHLGKLLMKVREHYRKKA